METRPSRLCTLCGARPARHHHIPNLERVLEAAPPEAWSQVVADGNSAEYWTRLPGEPIVWICDECAPNYAARHPEFVRQPNPGKE
jgi:hypothetical protein